MFGGLLASAIAKMSGVQGYSSWRWIFILEGIVTILLGIAAFFFASDFPEHSRWLTEEERAFVIARSGADKKGVRPIKRKDLLLFFGDPKNLLAGIIYFSIVIPAYGTLSAFTSYTESVELAPPLSSLSTDPTNFPPAFAYFAPTIVKTLVYTTIQTQLHTVPPFAAAFALCLLMAYLSDRLRLRYPFVAFGTLLTITGLAILMTTHHNFHAQYAGLCLVAMGAFSAGLIVVCWYVMNLEGHVERSIGTAWMISFGNTGGIVATFAFLARDAPRYRMGYSIVMAFTCVGAVASTLYAGAVVRENRKGGRGRLSL